MNTRLLLLLPLLITLPNLAQDDCAFALEIPDSITVSCDSCFTVGASFESLKSTDSYVVESIIDATPPYPTNVGTPVSLSDDAFSPAISMGFNFCFYGASYTNAILGSNGVVTFDMSEASGYCPWSFSAQCPSPSLPTNAIFTPYHDMNPNNCGNVRYEEYGEAPCRVFVVNYDAVCLFSCSSSQTTSQLVLYETSNNIEIYIVNKPSCGGWNSGNTLLGIQNSSGTDGLAAPDRNTSSWSTSNEAWRFVPDGEESGSISWYAGTELLGEGESIDICPDTSMFYYAALNYDLCTPAIDLDNCAIYDLNVTSGFSPNQISWELLNESNQVVYSGGAPYSGELCLANGCYTLEMFDTQGNGWNGALWVLEDQDDNNIISATLPLGSNGDIDFCVDGFVPDEGEIEAHVLDSVYVTVLFDDVNPGLEQPPVLCSGDEPFQLEYEADGGTWNSSCENCLDTLSAIFDPTIAGVGIHQVSYSLEGECGPVVNVVNIEVQEYSEPELFGPDSLCQFGELGQFSSDIEGGIWTADCGSCLDSLSGVFDPTGLELGIIEISYTLGPNCPVTEQTEVEIITFAESTIVPIDGICEGDIVSLEVDGLQNGVWSSDCECLNPDNGTFYSELSGLGVFTVSFTNDWICPSTDEIEVEVFPQVDASISDVPELCETGDIFQVDALNSGGNWSSDCGDCLNDTGVFDPGSSGPGTFEVIYTIDGVCSDSDSRDVVVLPQLDASIIMDAKLCLDIGEYQSYATDVGGVWSADCGSCMSDDGFLDLSDVEPGILFIEYDITGLCGDYDSHEVLVEPCSILIPNVFSPNNDGSNDALVFGDLEFFPGSTLIVYNRWGNEIFTSVNYQNSWQAEGVPDGTYYFILKRGDGEEFSGSITIAR